MVACLTIELKYSFQDSKFIGQNIHSLLLYKQKYNNKWNMERQRKIEREKERESEGGDRGGRDSGERER